MKNPCRGCAYNSNRVILKGALGSAYCIGCKDGSRRKSRAEANVKKKQSKRNTKYIER